MKKIMVAALLTGCFLFGTLMAGSSAASSGQTKEFVSIMSGRYYLTPKKHWLAEGMMPIKYSQIHFFVLANNLSRGSALAPNDTTKSVKSWSKIRKKILNKLVKAKLLTKSGRSSSHPKELYSLEEWDRAIQQSFYIHSKKYFEDYCEAKLVVRALKLSSVANGTDEDGNFMHWDEFEFRLPKGSSCN